MASSLNTCNLIIHNRYQLIDRIGEGSFGVIYLGKDNMTQQNVAVKVESINAPYKTLLRESALYTILGTGCGIPFIRYYGEFEDYHVLVMDLLGPSLEHLFKFCSRHFSVQTMIMLADQMISRLEFIHGRCIIHRDMKPENFLVGRGNQDDTLFLIDFGLGELYYNQQTGRHIPYEVGKELIGTASFSSINTHNGIAQSRRDDLESLGYVLLYFLRRGQLPWQRIQSANKKQRFDRMKEMKMAKSIEKLCNKNDPLKFSIIMYFQYCRILEFDELPNYTFLRELFRCQWHKPWNSPLNLMYNSWTKARSKRSILLINILNSVNIIDRLRKGMGKLKLFKEYKDTNDVLVQELEEQQHQRLQIYTNQAKNILRFITRIEE